jgi:hypothetical protein
MHLLKCIRDKSRRQVLATARRAAIDDGHDLAGFGPGRLSRGELRCAADGCRDGGNP